MIDDWWERIAGLHTERDGRIGVVWVARDTHTGVAHIYDAAVFVETLPAVLAEGMGARGRYIPLAWRKDDKAIAGMLDEAGINVLPDPVEDKGSMAEMAALAIRQKLEASTLRVDRRVSSWLQEYDKYYRSNAKLPDGGFPLMAATRHAISMIEWAEPARSMIANRRHSPKMRVV